MDWHSESFGQLLRQLRVAAKLTQEELAEAAGISTRSVSDIERGINLTTRRDTARLLADALKLSGDARDSFEAAARGRYPANGTAAAARALPRDVSSFTGRNDELRGLAETVKASAAAVGVCAVTGMAGAGKTAFAVHAAYQLTPLYPDGQIFLPLHAHTPGQRAATASDALVSLLQTMGVSAAQLPADLAARASLWRALMAGKKLLLLLDDAADSEQIKPLLPGSGASLVLVTSRRHLTALEDAWTISLDALPPLQAASLLVRLAARRGLQETDPAIEDIARLCGFLPLAISMLGRQLYHHPAWTAAGLAADLAAAKDRLALMHTEDLSVAAAFELSYAELSVEQQHLFRSLGSHPGTEIDAYAAAALDGCSLTSARANLETLYDHCLLAEPAPGRYLFHDLVAEYARRLAEQDDISERDDALRRLLEYYRKTAEAADRHLSRQFSPGWRQSQAPGGGSARFTSRSDAAAWLDTERVNLHAAVKQAVSCGQGGFATTIAASMREFLRSHGHWDQAMSLHQAALDAAHAAGSQIAEARAVADLADMQFLTDDYPAALTSFDRALGLYRSLGDTQAEARVLTSLSHVQQATGDYDAAAAGLSRALELCRSLDDQAAEADAVTSLGTVQYLTGDYPAAARSLGLALELYRHVGDAVGEADALTSLGTVHYLAGDYSSAAASQSRALRLYQGMGNRLGAANALTDLATVQNATGDRSAAAESLASALALFRDLGDRSGEAEALNNMGELMRASAPREAREYHEQARRLATSIAAPREEARALAGIGMADITAGDTTNGRTHLRDAIAIYRRIGSPQADELEQQLCSGQQFAEPVPELSGCAGLGATLSASKPTC